MKFILKCLAVLFAALILGAGSAVLGMRSFFLISSIRNGAWHTNFTVGSREAGMYTRAIVARYGLFALNKTETVYYGAETDDTGEPLRSSCDYTIEGRDVNARWWSITAYGRDQFLIPNVHDRYSYSVNSVLRESDGSFKIHLSSMQKEGNWIPTGDESRLFLSLRLYNPSKEVYNNPETIKLPRITREGCR